MFNGTRWGTFKQAPTRTCSHTASFFYLCNWCDPPDPSCLRRTTITKRCTATFSIEHVSLLESFIEPWIEPSVTPVEDRDKLLFHLQSSKEFSWIATTLEISPSVDKLLADFLNGSILSVSDGSFNPDVKAGAAGWTVESLDGTQFIRGGGRTAGSSVSQGAYHIELVGLLGLSMALWAIETTHLRRKHHRN